MTRRPEDWTAAEADLQTWLARVDEGVRARTAELHAHVEAAVVEPLHALVAEATEMHGRLMERHGFDRPAEAAPRPPEEVWEALLAYRRETAEVYERLHDGLRARDVGAAVGGPFEEAFASLLALGEDAPREIVRPEPVGLVEAEVGDRTALRVRKATERARRRLRAGRRGIANGARALVRRDPAEPELHVQVVPLRRLLDEHVTLRVAHLLTERHARTQQALGEAVARLEEALASWTDTVLRAESALDRPRFHADALARPASPDPTPDAPGHGPEVRRVREAAHHLDRALREAAFAVPEPSGADLDALHAALEERVRRSGYDRTPEPSTVEARPDDARPAPFAADATRWAAWHRHVVQRLGVDVLLLRFRARLVGEIERLIEAVAAAVIGPVRAAIREATDTVDRLRADAARAFDSTEAEGLARALRALLREALAYVDGTLLPTLQPISLDRTVEQAVEETQKRIAEAVAAVPERLTLHARLAPGRAGQSGPAAEVALRTVVRTLLSDEFAARLVRNADPLRQPLFRSISDAEGIRDVVRYNLEAAIEELETAAETGDREAAARADARELTVDGLARSTERLEALATPLDEPWQAFVRGTTETFEKAWTALHQRVNTQSLVEAQFLDFKTRASRTLDRSRAAVQRLRERAERSLRKGFRLGRREAKRLVQIGQAAAGLASQSVAARQRTLDALAEAPRLHATLPLVYRRLFSFAPITDPGLFVGRQASLDRVAAQFERWRTGLDSSALIVTATAGGGRTSFVKTLEATALAGASVATVTLAERVSSTEDFAALLGAALGATDEASQTLDGLEAYLRTDVPSRPRVCIVERLEHLFLRTVGGLDVLERALVFMSRTDKQVFWLGTMVESGWQFVERTAPQLTGLADAVALPPLTRGEIEETLMRRHQRSGLPLRFAEPTEPAPLLARRLGKARTPAERQAILQGEFFDGLYRASGPYPMLALLYWLRAADFEAVADTLTLRPVRPLDFTFIAQFDPARAFVLKALLQHGSLTLAEHDRIFRTTRQESFLLFESLQNLRLIQRADAPPEFQHGGLAPEPVYEDARYRLHPLAVAPVTDALRAKNIL